MELKKKRTKVYDKCGRPAIHGGVPLVTVFCTFTHEQVKWITQQASNRNLYITDVVRDIVAREMTVNEKTG